MTNPMNQTDFYKVNHRTQYPEDTSLVFSNFTPRSGKHFNRDVDGVVFLGLQKFIIEHMMQEWTTEFFSRPKHEAVGEYQYRIETSLGPNAIDFDHVAALHDLGYLPVRIRALPEGAVVPFKVPMFTIENTLPEFFWLTNYLETVMSCEIWKPSTVATIAREYRKILEVYAEETGADQSMIPLSVHDFSMRGMSGRADAANSGVGHLLSFVGTDNIPAIDCAEKFYFGDAGKELIGTSIPASEHSVMCAGGKEDEFDTYRRFITELYPNGLVGIVSDTWDLWNVLTEIAPALKDEIMARDGKVVFRPDSGDPVDILCGTVTDDIGETNEEKGAVQILWEQFGGTINEKGFKELDSHVGLIYGDSITLNRCQAICQRLKNKGFSSGNVVFGVGSFTYQMITRDTFGMAMKATYCERGEQGYEIFKDPITDDGVKKSAKGLLMVVEDPERPTYALVDQVGWAEVQSDANQLKVVYEDGILHQVHTLSQIRERVAQSF